jgi:glycosyltransferase involved in cell wall biosynthesis
VRVIVTGPCPGAVSGIATHVELLVKGEMPEDITLEHFWAGGEGLTEAWWTRSARRFSAPVRLFVRLHSVPVVLHINTALNPRALCRDVVFLMVSRCAGCPAVWQVHGGRGVSELGGVSGSLYRQLLRWARRIVVITRTEHGEYLKLDPRLDVCRIPNAVSIHDVQIRACNPHAPLHLLFMSRLIEQKGIFQIIEAVRVLLDRRFTVVLHIAGVGPAEQEVRHRIQSLGLQEHIRFVGCVRGADKSRLLSDSDLLLFPTSHQERLPYALLESMAAGVVPITCAVGAINEVVEHGHSGVLLSAPSVDLLVSAIETFERNRALLEEMSRSARQRVRESFCSDRMVRQFAELYREVA